MIVVADAGPLISLARIGRFELLRYVFGQLTIPQAVHDEVVVKGAGRAGAEEMQSALDIWIGISLVQDTMILRSLLIKLGRGESEAIQLAVEQGADLLLLDDRKARSTAEFLGLDVSGTVGVLIQAHRKGLGVDLEQALNELRSRGFYISDAVYARALAESDQES